mmetsp:Transcript_50149/g.68521  ORF Transcript_50149/g.68521 Transcript_50149/m.68521 type:complete len:100 (-) Transcript_50149:511-810(-)
MVISNTIAMRAYHEDANNSDEIKALKEAEVLASDCILNHKTVASFGYDNVILNEYYAYLSGSIAKKIRASHCEGLSNGFSQFMKNCMFIGISICGNLLM